MKFDAFRARFFAGVPRYRWLGTLGHGGIGVVFKAHDVTLDEVVAAVHESLHRPRAEVRARG